MIPLFQLVPISIPPPYANPDNPLMWNLFIVIILLHIIAAAYGPISLIQLRLDHIGQELLRRLICTIIIIITILFIICILIILKVAILGIIVYGVISTLILVILTIRGDSYHL